MNNKISPYLIKQSKEKLTDKGGLSLFDEFLTGLDLPGQIDRTFPSPGSGKGIKPADYIRTLIYHFADGGRHLEEIEQLRSDGGFRSLIKLEKMPGSDAVGNWLRRCGHNGGTDMVQILNDKLVGRYVSVSSQKEFVFDADSTIIESNKGDATYSYKKIQGYHPMLGWLSDGRDEPFCSYVKFRQGSASAQTDILEAIQHTKFLLPEGKVLKYFRSDSAAYQAKLIDYCNDNGIYYTITADQDVSVREVITTIPSKAWKRIHDRIDGFKLKREVAETIHTMNNSNHSFRLIVQRELKEKPDLFGDYSYYCIITNIPLDDNDDDNKTAEEVVWHHNGRGNCERYIEDTKYGINLRFVPCGQFEANALYYSIGILAFNLLKLMQMMVLPKSWLNRTVRSLRRRFLRMVAKVTHSGRQCFLQINRTMDEIRELIRVREKIWLLYQAL